MKKLLSLFGAALMCGSFAAQAIPVTLNFSGMDDAYTHVIVKQDNGSGYETVDVTNNPFDVDAPFALYQYSTNITIEAKDGYNITNVIRTSSLGGSTITSPATDGGAWAIKVQYITGEYPSFDVTVEEEGGEDQSPYVILDFVGATNAYKYVNVTDQNGNVSISENPFTYNYKYNADIEFTAVEGWEISDITCDNPNRYDIEVYSPFEMFPWSLEISNNNASGSKVTIYVKNNGGYEEPEPEDGPFVTFNFEGVGSVADAYQHVTMVDANNSITIDSNPFVYYFQNIPNYTQAFGNSIILTGKDGYVITSVTSDNPYISIKEGTDNSYTIRMYMSMADSIDGSSFTVQVADDNTTGINTISAYDEEDVIYNLQGVRVNADNITTGIYIVNGKKVVIR